MKYKVFSNGNTTCSTQSGRIKKGWWQHFLAAGGHEAPGPVCKKLLLPTLLYSSNCGKSNVSL